MHGKRVPLLEWWAPCFLVTSHPVTLTIVLHNSLPDDYSSQYSCSSQNTPPSTNISWRSHHTVAWTLYDNCYIGPAHADVAWGFQATICLLCLSSYRLYSIHWTSLWHWDLTELIEHPPWMPAMLPEVGWSLGCPNLLDATMSRIRISKEFGLHVCLTNEKKIHLDLDVQMGELELQRSRLWWMNITS